MEPIYPPIPDRIVEDEFEGDEEYRDLQYYLLVVIEEKFGDKKIDQNERAGYI